MAYLVSSGPPVVSWKVPQQAGRRPEVLSEDKLVSLIVLDKHLI